VPTTDRSDEVDFAQICAEHQPNETDPYCRVCGDEYPCDLAWAASSVLLLRERRRRRGAKTEEEPMSKEKIQVDLTGATWEKSTFSSGNTDNCLEVAFVGTSIAVRDSNDEEGNAQVYDRGEWQAFLDGVKSGQFDLV